MPPAQVEVVARRSFERFVAALRGRGPGACAPVTRVEISVRESDVAAASYFEEGADVLGVGTGG